MNNDRSVKFSVVIPTYNRENFISQTLESVFSQKHQNYEVIVVDNCSTDRTVEILRPLIERNKIRFIQHDRNYERARSRNTGMENATGDFLTFLDSDDFMLPENLADAASFARENPSFKCFHNLYSLVDASGKTIYKYKFPTLRNHRAAISAGNFMSCIGNFIAKEIYENYRFDTFPALTGGEDWDFWLRVFADYEVGRIDKYNSAILHHPGRTVVNQNIDEMESGLRHLIRKFRADEHLSTVYKDLLDRIEANAFLYLNLLANDARSRSKASSYLRTALRSDPSVFFTMRFMRSLRRTVLN